ncbi:phage recombination protein Bet [Gulosibacter hominis]|uniref:phage recombination protein Bet n=1 Tax=Gulosibacter hominis TaxID=2770504 RepID=UPI001918418B|nr:phage recombination protein Bet [Gulosibacter hominis]
MSEITKLPSTGDVSTWTPAEVALAESIGLRDAPRPTIEAFLVHCARTQLDPVARQIYAIQRWTKNGPKWGIQISIDGARLVAERSGEYRGQTAPQWTADGVTWVDVWLDPVPPAAARVGVYRQGFVEPMVAVATMAQYRSAGKAPLWDKMPALMLAKCAEMLALRKAFPQDLSGLYTSEEMDQAGDPGPVEPVEPVETVEPVEPVEPELPRTVSRDWVSDAAHCTAVTDLQELWRVAATAGELALEAEPGVTVKDLLIRRSVELKDEVIDAEVVDDVPAAQ